MAAVRVSGSPFSQPVVVYHLERERLTLDHIMDAIRSKIL